MAGRKIAVAGSTAAFVLLRTMYEIWLKQLLRNYRSDLLTLAILCENLEALDRVVARETCGTLHERRPFYRGFKVARWLLRAVKRVARRFR
jgi:hypothetical protein